MHIPDGYLSPATCGIMYALAVPLWVKAMGMVRKTFKQRSIPTLALLSAFSFLIMMFNIPVPGGTTAHGVGGTLIAILLGPWAALIGESLALIVQAFFFGDGGLTAIGANCFNMGFVLPFVGYFVYRLISRGSPLNSSRRWVSAAIGSYLGINAAAQVAAIEFGLQPYFFHNQAGVPLYCPYTLSKAIPAMLIAHLLIGLVEAIITAAVVSFLGKHHPEVFELNPVNKEGRNETL